MSPISTKKETKQRQKHDFSLLTDAQFVVLQTDNVGKCTDIPGDHCVFKYGLALESWLIALHTNTTSALVELY